MALGDVQCWERQWRLCGPCSLLSYKALFSLVVHHCNEWPDQLYKERGFIWLSPRSGKSHWFVSFPAARTWRWYRLSQDTNAHVVSGETTGCMWVPPSRSSSVTSPRPWPSDTKVGLFLCLWTVRVRLWGATPWVWDESHQRLNYSKVDDTVGCLWLIKF